MQISFDKPKYGLKIQRCLVLSVVDAQLLCTITASASSSIVSTTPPEDKSFNCRLFLLHCSKQVNLVVVTASQGNTAATTMTKTSPRLIDNDSDTSKVPVKHSSIDEFRKICCCSRGHVPQLKSSLSAELRKIVVWVTKNLTATHNKYTKYFIRG